MSSKDVLQRELNAARLISRNDAARVHRPNRCVRRAEVRSVREVERLEAELDLMILPRHYEISCQHEIKVLSSRSPNTTVLET